MDQNPTPIPKLKQTNKPDPAAALSFVFSVLKVQCHVSRTQGSFIQALLKIDSTTVVSLD